MQAEKVMPMPEFQKLVSFFTIKIFPLSTSSGPLEIMSIIDLTKRKKEGESGENLEHTAILNSTHFLNENFYESLKIWFKAH